MPNILILIAFVLALWWGLVHIVTNPDALRVINIVAGVVVAVLAILGLVKALPLGLFG